MLDDASIFRAMLRTGKNGGAICMRAENGGATPYASNTPSSTEAELREAFTIIDGGLARVGT